MLPRQGTQRIAKPGHRPLQAQDFRNEIQEGIPCALHIPSGGLVERDEPAPEELLEDARVMHCLSQEAAQSRRFLVRLITARESSVRRSRPYVDRAAWPHQQVRV